MTDLEKIVEVIKKAQKPLTAKEIIEVAQEVTGESIKNAANVHNTAKNCAEIIYQFKSEAEKNKPTRFWLYSEMESVIINVIGEQLTGQGNRGKTEAEIIVALTDALEHIEPKMRKSSQLSEDMLSLFQSFCDSGKEITANPQRPYMTFDGKRYKLTSEKTTKDLSSVSEEKNKEELEKTEAKAITISDLLEEDLHDVLASFVAQDQHFTCYTKTIVAQGARKKPDESLEWNYPDMVGVSYPFGDLRKKHGLEMNETSLALADILGAGSLMLFAFELKQTINKGNLKQSYFQAVSNSSWANEGYLVAAEYDPKLINEMRRLASAFGIGFIRLDLQNYKNSEVLISARSKDELDWVTIDKLVADDNSTGFTPFIQSITLNMNSRKGNGYFSDETYKVRLTQEQLVGKFQQIIKERQT